MVIYNIGDLPSWIQAFTAVLASIFLIVTIRMQSKTLKLQQLTSEDQKELLKLTTEKNVLSIMPNFKYDSNKCVDGMAKFEITFVLDHNPALKVILHLKI